MVCISCEFVSCVSNVDVWQIKEQDISDLSQNTCKVLLSLIFSIVFKTGMPQGSILRPIIQINYSFATKILSVWKFYFVKTGKQVLSPSLRQLGKIDYNQNLVNLFVILEGHQINVIQLCVSVGTFVFRTKSLSI